MRLAHTGHSGDVWVVADEQTGGRGRNGRVWASPSGNLHASLLLINPAPISRSPELGFVAGVALATTLRETLDGDERLKIKWPNDMMYDGTKLSGLMLEGAQLQNGRFACVIGIGVNCTTAASGLAYATTSLSDIVARPVIAADIFSRLAANMNHWLARYDQGRNFAHVRTCWLQMAAGLNQPIVIANGERHITGTFATIDAIGRLILTTPDGPQTVAAGDVFLTGPIREINSPQPSTPTKADI